MSKDKNKTNLENLKSQLDTQDNSNNSEKETKPMNDESTMPDLDDMVNGGTASVADIFASFDATAAKANSEYKLPAFNTILKCVCTKVSIGKTKSGANIGSPKLEMQLKTEDGASVFTNTVLTKDSSFLLAIFSSFGLLNDEGKPSVADPNEFVGLSCYAKFKPNVWQGKTNAQVKSYHTEEEYDNAQ